MTAKPRRKCSSTVGRNEVLRDSRGRAIDDEYVKGGVEDAIGYVRGRGRPSLSSSGESPLLRVRVSRELQAAVQDAAAASGESTPAWVRRTLARAARPSDAE